MSWLFLLLTINWGKHSLVLINDRHVQVTRELQWHCTRERARAALEHWVMSVLFWGVCYALPRSPSCTLPTLPGHPLLCLSLPCSTDVWFLRLAVHPQCGACLEFVKLLFKLCVLSIVPVHFRTLHRPPPLSAIGRGKATLHHSGKYTPVVPESIWSFGFSLLLLPSSYRHTGLTA